jgi:type VI secretion system protein ImpK
LADDNDPFAAPDLDRTVIVPTPGGRSAAASRPPATPALPAEPTALGRTASGAGLNPLVAAANPILDMVPRLRVSLTHSDPGELRARLANALQAFETDARARGIDPVQVRAASYALCTLLDETAASTPWGGSGLWAKHSLLVLFHNETWGGEKFFQLLSRLAEDPAKNRTLLELLYVCLALGFEGRYRVAGDGRGQLQALRERLALMLRNVAGEYERDLSPHWRAAPGKARSALGGLPWWVAAALAGLVATVAYLGFSWRLNEASDPVYAAIQAIRMKPPEQRAVPPSAPVPPRLATFLAPEIAGGLVAVRENDRESVVTILGDGLFAAGSASVSGDFMPLLGRIAEAVAGVPGRVLVTGHTDSTPIRSARFPSNWHLSQERAGSVAQKLQAKVPASRISAEGRADSEPIAPNDTPANRAKNRRVEITVAAAPAAAGPRQ